MQRSSNRLQQVAEEQRTERLRGLRSDILLAAVVLAIIWVIGVLLTV
jgi:hypothetical protein